jgi:hypothetical protein
MSLLVVALSLAPLALASAQTPAAAAPQPQMDAATYSASFRLLFELFVLAVLIESGLSVIFNWRPFKELFDSRGMKTLVSLTFSFVFVSVFDLDMTTALVNVYAGTNDPVNLPGKVVTALVLSGGSSGVNNILVALGFRQISDRPEDKKRPPATEAWIAVKLRRVNAVGPVTVRIGTPDKELPVAGTITGTGLRGGRFLNYFLRDQGRFPTAEGYPVPAGETYKIVLEGVNATGAPLPASPGSTWGPYPLAKGALIDLELSL